MLVVWLVLWKTMTGMVGEFEFKNTKNYKIFPQLDSVTIGIQGATSTFPCPYCFARNYPKKGGITFGQNAELRTLGNLSQLAKQNAEDPRDPKDKNAIYKNVVHEPLFSGTDDTKIMDILSIPGNCSFEYVI